MIEFFFDCSSPWTYLAFHNIQPLAKEFGVDIVWRPILVGGIFNTVNPSVYAQREKPVPAKAAYMLKDLGDWARSAGLKIKMPPSVFPVNSVKAMRGCIWLGQDMVPFARSVFEIYWGEDHSMCKKQRWFVEKMNFDFLLEKFDHKKDLGHYDYTILYGAAPWRGFVAQYQPVKEHRKGMYEYWHDQIGRAHV